MTSTRAPFPKDPDEFGNDPRIFFSRESDSYRLEDEGGEEWEWSDELGAWKTLIDAADVEQMQAQYRVEGVDENAPAFDASKKRKAHQEAKAESNKKRKEDQKEDSNTAVFVTGLPLDTDEVEVHRVFSDCGPIAISLVDGEPRVKLYYNKKVEFLGEAFIVYQRAQSAEIALNKFNGTDFNRGPAVDGPLKVVFARKIVKAQPQQESGTATKSESDVIRPKLKTKTLGKADRARRQAKEAEISLNWNRDSDSEDEDEGRARRARWDRLVILSPMFTLEELAADEDAYDEIKLDVYNECAKFGDVTNLVLWDLEPRGVVTVRFADPDSAEQCITALNGRKFADQPVRAALANGYETYKKKIDKEMVDNNTVDAPDVDRKGKKSIADTEKAPA